MTKVPLSSSQRHTVCKRRDPKITLRSSVPSMPRLQLTDEEQLLRVQVSRKFSFRHKNVPRFVCFFRSWKLWERKKILTEKSIMLKIILTFGSSFHLWRQTLDFVLTDLEVHSPCGCWSFRYILSMCCHKNNWQRFNMFGYWKIWHYSEDTILKSPEFCLPLIVNPKQCFIICIQQHITFFDLQNLSFLFNHSFCLNVVSYLKSSCLSWGHSDSIVINSAPWIL